MALALSTMTTPKPMSAMTAAASTESTGPFGLERIRAGSSTGASTEGDAGAGATRNVAVA